MMLFNLCNRVCQPRRNKNNTRIPVCEALDKVQSAFRM